MRIVIKIGTNLLTTQDSCLDNKRIKSIAQDVAALKKDGHQIVIVTSGAICAGMGKLKLNVKPADLKEKQALAAIGQPILMDTYKEYFDDAGIVIAQLLLTRSDFDQRQNYLNARSTLFKLLDMGAVPIINENDTVAVEEINFGENDTLAALVAAKISAQCLILLTDVDGLYKGAVGKSEIIAKVDKITDDIEKYATVVSSSGKGSGGMLSKINAAKIAAANGVKTFIVNGLKENAIIKAASGQEIGTVFMPRQALEPRKCWIAFGAKCRGKIIIDDGAVTAIRERKKSLLPSGIVAVDGKFEIGDTISISDRSGKEVARGLTYYSSEVLDKIKKKKSSEIKKILPNVDYEEAVHRDNLVIL
ncbi:MAG: glutamate 5-kinase [Elusimicrobia bacterium]|nr:glutamate 5-kinase [Candidatus Liberimonas magnetica]